jgi:amidase
MGELAPRTALDLAAAIRRLEVSPLEVLDDCLAAVDTLDERVNAVVWRDDERVRAAAREAGDEVMRREVEELPPFHGVPIPIKDLTEVAGWPTSYGSWGTPDGLSAYSAPAVEALQVGGFVVAAKTATPAFGLITATEGARWGITRNPWDTDRTPGGSSGGAAAAVAAGMFPIAHATDGGGSIRIPASCCGLVGLKASRGRVLSAVTAWEGGAVNGVVSRDVADTAAVLDLIGGWDRGSWYNAPLPERPFAAEVGADPGRLRIGLLTEAPLGLPVDPACVAAARQTATALEAAGHVVVEAALPLPDWAMEAFVSVVNSGLADYEGVDWSRTEPHVQAARRDAAAIDSLTYVRSVHALQLDTRQVVEHWGPDWDVLITPTMTIEPPRAGAIIERSTEKPDAGNITVAKMAALTSRFNITGLPAISLPVGSTDSGVPVGVQLVGGPWGEARLLRVASQVEQALPWQGRRPAL